MSEETPLRIEFYPSGAIHLFNLKADEESLGIDMNELIKFLKNIYKEQLESCQPKGCKDCDDGNICYVWGHKDNPQNPFKKEKQSCGKIMKMKNGCNFCYEDNLCESCQPKDGDK